MADDRPAIGSVRVCVAGPFDGLGAACSEEAFAFIDHEGRCHAEPRKGRALYARKGERWLYAGERAYRCKCGAFNLEGAHCGICGARKPKRRDRAA